MRLFIIIFIGKILTFVSKRLNLGSGSTWPGHIAIKLFPQIISYFSKQIKKGVIVIAGTNGKTTTSKIITDSLEKSGFFTLHNQQGANLLNGLASAFINKSNLIGKINIDYAIFEVDENTLPLVLNLITPQIIVLLNLFRDQLDRYGEVDLIAEKWKKSMLTLDDRTSCVINGDDPKVVYICKDLKCKSHYFGLNEKYCLNSNLGNEADTVYCPQCQKRLSFKKVSFSHLGKWECQSCGLKSPKLDLDSPCESQLHGIFNKYNILAASLVLKIIGLNQKTILKNIKDFKPAFGRGEKLKLGKNKIILQLAKNPTGFNQSLITFLANLRKEKLILLLNDKIPDGRDVSWIWDVNFEMLKEYKGKIIIGGQRAFEMALRLKYANLPKSNLIIKENLNDVISEMYKFQNNNYYILATYSAMLQIRKLITGQKFIRN